MKTVLLAVLAGAAMAAAPRVPLECRVFPGLADMDGNWSALFAASDGKVYAGLAHHGAGGHLVYYDSKTDRVVDVGNLNRITGQEFLLRGPQSKIHAKFGEGKDGRICFGTHGGNFWGLARLGTKDGYPGSQWMAFEPTTGTTENFGLAIANEGMVTGAYDPLLHRIYGMSWPSAHFLWYDVKIRQTGDMGRINNWESVCRSLGIDDRGDVHGSFGNGQIFRYDPRANRIRALGLRLPIREKGISLGRDYDKSETGWRALAWDNETGRFYGVEESASILFSFDPHKGEEGEVVRLGQMGVPGMEDSREAAFATPAFTLGKDRKLYYAAAREFDYGVNSKGGVSHLITYDLINGRIRDLGEMRLDDGRRVIGSNAASTGPDGTIYFIGALEVRPEPGKPVEAGGKIGGSYYRLALLIYRPRS